MSEQDKELEVRFAPGVLDEFEGTQEELNEFIAEIKNLALRGDLQKNSRPVDMDALAEQDPELHELLVRKLKDIETEKDSRRLN